MTYENSPAYGSQLATQLRIRDCGSFADWLTPVLPVGISACFGMLARRPAFMLARRHERLGVRTVPLTAPLVSVWLDKTTLSA